MRKTKLILLLLTAALLLSACAPSGSDEALQDQVESLSGKVEQLQDKIADLEHENQLLQSDSVASAADDLSYLLDTITQSGQTVTSFPALITAISRADDDAFTLTFLRQDKPDAAPEQIQADRFTYTCYDGYLLPELDESFSDYLAGFEGGAPFTIYLLGDSALYLSELTDS